MAPVMAAKLTMRQGKGGSGGSGQAHRRSRSGRPSLRLKAGPDAEGASRRGKSRSRRRNREDPVLKPRGGSPGNGGGRGRQGSASKARRGREGRRPRETDRSGSRKNQDGRPGGRRRSRSQKRARSGSGHTNAGAKDAEGCNDRSAGAGGVESFQSLLKRRRRSKSGEVTHAGARAKALPSRHSSARLIRKKVRRRVDGGHPDADQADKRSDGHDDAEADEAAREPSREGRAFPGVRAKAKAKRRTSPGAEDEQEGLTCRKGHSLEDCGIKNTGWKCDGFLWFGKCHSNITDFHQTDGMKSLECGKCDFTVCESCYAVRAGYQVKPDEDFAPATSAKSAPARPPKHLVRDLDDPPPPGAWGPEEADGRDAVADGAPEARRRRRRDQGEAREAAPADPGEAVRRKRARRDMKELARRQERFVSPQPELPAAENVEDAAASDRVARGEGGANGRRRRRKRAGEAGETSRTEVRTAEDLAGAASPIPHPPEEDPPSPDADEGRAKDSADEYAEPEVQGPDDEATKYSALIRHIYKIKNPAKLPEVEGLLEKYSGSEDEVFRQLCKKYDVHPKEFDHDNWRTAVGAKRRNRDGRPVQRRRQDGSNSGEAQVPRLPRPPAGLQQTQAPEGSASQVSGSLQPPPGRARAPAASQKKGFAKKASAPPPPTAPQEPDSSDSASAGEPEPEVHFFSELDGDTPTPGWPFADPKYEPNTDMSSSEDNESVASSATAPSPVPVPTQAAVSSRQVELAAMAHRMATPHNTSSAWRSGHTQGASMSDSDSDKSPKMRAAPAPVSPMVAMPMSPWFPMMHHPVPIAVAHPAPSPQREDTGDIGAAWGEAAKDPPAQRAASSRLPGDPYGDRRGAPMAPLGPPGDMPPGSWGAPGPTPGTPGFGHPGYGPPPGWSPHPPGYAMHHPWAHPAHGHHAPGGAPGAPPGAGGPPGAPDGWPGAHPAAPPQVSPHNSMPPPSAPPGPAAGEKGDWGDKGGKGKKGDKGEKGGKGRDKGHHKSDKGYHKGDKGDKGRDKGRDKGGKSRDKGGKGKGSWKG